MGLATGTPARQSWWQRLSPVVAQLAAERTTRVAVLSTDADYILGWICHEGPLVHYVSLRYDVWADAPLAGSVLAELLGPLATREAVGYSFEPVELLKRKLKPAGWYADPIATMRLGRLMDAPSEAA